MSARSVAVAKLLVRDVHVSVRLYTTSRSAKGGELRFAQLHAKDGGKLQQKMVCTRCNEFVDQDKTVRGYERAKDDYVTFTQEDIKRLDAITPNTITIDPTFIEKSFYLGPNEGAERAFAVVREMLSAKPLAALGMYAANRRESLVCVQPHHDGLILHQLKFDHEVVSWKDMPPSPPVSLDRDERELAATLATKLHRSTFSPGAYRDGIQEQLLSQVNRKLAGQEIVVPRATDPDPSPSLIDALKRSIERPDAR